MPLCSSSIANCNFHLVFWYAKLFGVFSFTSSISEVAFFLRLLYSFQILVSLAYSNVFNSFRTMPHSKSLLQHFEATFNIFCRKMLCEKKMKNVFTDKASLSHNCSWFNVKILERLHSNRKLMIKNDDFWRTNFMIAIGFWSFIVVVKLSVSIDSFKKSLKRTKYEACQVLEYFVLSILSFLKEWRKTLKRAMLCRKDNEWLTLLVRPNLIMSAKKKSIWYSQMHQKVLRILKEQNDFLKNIFLQNCSLKTFHFQIQFSLKLPGIWKNGDLQ